MNELIVLFLFFGWVSLMLKSSERSTGSSMYWSRPLPPKKRKGSVPRMKNPPNPPKKIGNCYMDCGNTRPSPGPDVICLNCGSSIIK